MRFILIIVTFIISTQYLVSQETKKRDKFLHLFENAPELNKPRFWGLNSTITVGYTASVVGLNQVWYAQYPRSKFHFFNDMGEWEDMDKIGHLFTAYMENKLTAQLYRWVGLNQKKSAYTGFVLSTIFQGTLETLDGFSDEWGWSWGDIGFNTAGSLLFLGQELAWREQRIVVKMSSWRSPLKDNMITSTDGLHTASLIERRNDLYGTNIAETLLKDYNSTTFWASLNIHSFMKNKNSWIPSWLNIAVGYGAENIFGGFENQWTDKETGAIFIVPENVVQRHRQFFLSFDVNTSKIPVKHKFLKALLSAINIIKIPAPAMEINSLGKVKFHIIHY